MRRERPKNSDNPARGSKMTIPVLKTRQGPTQQLNTKDHNPRTPKPKKYYCSKISKAQTTPQNNSGETSSSVWFSTTGMTNSSGAGNGPDHSRPSALMSTILTGRAAKRLVSSL
jgi:hypothetical protein